MRAIIIGAGRGQRLKPLTDNSHKTFTETDIEQVR
jgi:CTP:phosphocholine cytidylyltransferase-like protein